MHTTVWRAKKYRVCEFDGEPNGSNLVDVVCDTANNMKTRTPKNEMRAQLIADAGTSYMRHFGPNAVEAAKSDALGEALELLRIAVNDSGMHIDSASRNRIDDLLSRTKENT